MDLSRISIPFLNTKQGIGVFDADHLTSRDGSGDIL